MIELEIPLIDGGRVRVTQEKPGEPIWLQLLERGRDYRSHRAEPPMAMEPSAAGELAQALIKLVDVEVDEVGNPVGPPKVYADPPSAFGLPDA